MRGGAFIVAVVLANAGLLLLAACENDSSAVSPSHDYAPQPGDDALARGEAFVDSADLLALETFPPQFKLMLTGALPTPCHQLRAVVSPPDAHNRIAVSVYSVVDPEVICIQILQAFRVTLDIPTPPPGKYSVSVNGRPAGVIQY